MGKSFIIWAAEGGRYSEGGVSHWHSREVSHRCACVRTCVSDLCVVCVCVCYAFVFGDHLRVSYFSCSGILLYRESMVASE